MPERSASRNIDTLYFEAFDGDRDYNGVNYNDYADPNYVRGEGMVAIMLHELGHMSQKGFEFDWSSKNFYKREHGSLEGYAGSEYWSNNEAFVNDFAEETGRATGFDVSGVVAGMAGGWASEGRGPTDWQEAGNIYADNTSQAPSPSEPMLEAQQEFVQPHHQLMQMQYEIV